MCLENSKMVIGEDCQCQQSLEFEDKIVPLKNLPAEIRPLKKNLHAIQYALQANLTKFYEKVEVNIVDCPNLREEPYNLAAEGYGAGQTTVVDVGGPANLLPLVNKSKIYDLATIGPDYLDSKKYPDGFYVSGAGAGPWPSQKTNSEMIINMKVGKDGKLQENKSRVVSTSLCQCDKTLATKNLQHETRCAMLANVMVSSGKRGKVLEIKCSRRINPHTNFTTSIRQALATSFDKTPVALGGIFTLKNSKAETFVMPDFSETPLLSDQDVNKWLKYFHMEPPMLFQSVLVSAEAGLDLRPEHSHGWSLKENESFGGHYNHDLMPTTVEYHGYFAVADQILRLDRPTLRAAAA